MNFSNYSKQEPYNNPAFDKYLYHQQQKLYSPPSYSTAPPEPDNSFSLDEILLGDSNKLLDQVVNTALNISYRLKIYRDTNIALDEKWNELSTEICGLSSSQLGYNMAIEGRKGMLEKERNSIEKQKLEQKVNTWGDLNEPVRYFVQNFHKHLETKQDQKLIKG